MKISTLLFILAVIALIGGLIAAEFIYIPEVLRVLPAAGFLWSAVYAESKQQ